MREKILRKYTISKLCLFWILYLLTILFLFNQSPGNLKEFFKVLQTPLSQGKENKSKGHAWWQAQHVLCSSTSNASLRCFQNKLFSSKCQDGKLFHMCYTWGVGGVWMYCLTWFIFHAGIYKACFKLPV